MKQRGLILILRDLHDVVDRLTLGAYGWPDTLTEAQTVAHLVALNHERGAEERNGRVRWLRPAYQQPRSGLAPAQARSLSLVPLAAQTKRARPAFPKDRYEQPLAIQAALQTIGPVAPPELALRFSGGSRLEPRITRVLATLHRYGHVERLPDGRWITSRAA